MVLRPILASDSIQCKCKLYQNDFEHVFLKKHINKSDSDFKMDNFVKCWFQLATSNLLFG